MNYAISHYTYETRDVLEQVLGVVFKSFGLISSRQILLCGSQHAW